MPTDSPHSDAAGRIRAFVEDAIRPFADAWDRAEALPASVPAALAERGYLGASISHEWGGLGWGWPDLADLHEEIGRGCSTVRSLLTVHGMVAHAIARWGTAAQRQRWLPPLARGTSFGALALSEPDAGSDVNALRTAARATGAGYALDGTKKWITFGETADLLLVFARLEDRPAAFLVEAPRPGLRRTPLRGLLGIRAAGTAQIDFEDCRLEAESLLGRPGFGLSHVAMHALDFGRFSVACGAVGLAQACLEASHRYAGARVQFGVPIAQHQLISRMVTDMVVGVRTARLLCREAARLRARRDPSAIVETMVAKYHASRVATRAAADAVQIHGANGIGGDFPVQRFLRDSRVLEIIEGSTQLQQIMIAQNAAVEPRALPRATEEPRCRPKPAPSSA